MKKKRSWAWIIVILIVVVAAGGALMLQRALRTSAANLNAQQYEIAKVTKGDINVTVHGTGSIAVMDTSTVTANASAKVDSVLVENGDSVKKGQIIAKLNADAANDNITSQKNQITAQDATIAGMRAAPATKILYSPVDAHVKAIYAKLDDDVGVSMSANGALMVLSTDGKMKIDFVPESGVTVNAGETVKVAIGKVTVDGYISSVPDSTTADAEAIITDNSYSLNAKAVVKDAKGTELGNGLLAVNKPLLITADSGTVDHLYVSVNSSIKQGHKLVRLTGSILNPNFESQLEQRQTLQDNLNKAYTDLSNLTITSPADGVVTDLTLQEGGMAQDGMAVCTIQQNSSFKLVVAVDELDVPSIKIGQKAVVKIDALPDQPATGTVTKIASIGDVANDVTTYNVTLNVTAPAGTLANMSASADIEVASKSDALLVPVEAIHTVNGKTYVYGTLPGDVSADPSASPASSQSNGRFGGFFSRMRGGSGANGSKLQRQTIEVTVGLISDSSAEILSGLTEGQEIAVPVAQSSTSGMFNIGGGRNQGGQNNQPSATGAAATKQN